MAKDDEAITPLRERLAGWLASQPEVSAVTDLGGGIFGFAMAGPDGEMVDVSLVCQPTQ